MLVSILCAVVGLLIGMILGFSWAFNRIGTIMSDFVGGIKDSIDAKKKTRNEDVKAN